MIKSEGKLLNPVFIVSTGRSGSQMLAHVLRHHPCVCAFHEPMPTLNTEAYAAWSKSHSPDKISKKIASKRSRLIEQVTENRFRYVESSHFASHLIPLLESLYTPHIIYIHRDGLEFAKSGIERGWFESGQLGGLQERLKRLLRRAYMLDVGQPGRDHRLRPPSDLKTEFEKTAWLWAEINKVIMKDLASLPSDRVMTIGLADINSDSLRRIVNFLGLEPSEELLLRMSQTASLRPNKTERVLTTDWTLQELRRFDAIAGDVSRKLGYGLKAKAG